MVPIVTRVAADFEGRAVVGTVNVLDQESLARRWGVSGVPTFVYFSGGQEVLRKVGQTTYEDLVAPLETLLGSSRTPDARLLGVGSCVASSGACRPIVEFGRAFG
jgi:thioredoxin-like negative regulator of GroEL